jgi:two-component system chemotaxis response regulator CheY
MTRRVLTIDDSKTMRDMLMLTLSNNGFEVLQAVDGLDGLDVLGREMVDVVITDINMPGADGFEVIRRRTADRMPAVVFLTAFDQFAIRAFEAQALDYLVKPVSEARFTATIKRLARQLRTDAAPSRDHTIVVATSRGATVLLVREIGSRRRTTTRGCGSASAVTCCANRCVSSKRACARAASSAPIGAR